MLNISWNLLNTYVQTTLAIQYTVECHLFSMFLCDRNDQLHTTSYSSGKRSKFKI